MPKVSVIIPCYNQGQYLDEAVESVLAQTFQDFEIIIINDGSTDEFTNELLANYNKPKTTLVHTTNQGLSAARNNGIRASSGEYILPLDADDKLDPRYLEVAVDMIQDKSSGPFIVTTSKIYYFGYQNGIAENAKEGGAELFVGHYNNQVATSMYPRQLWELVGGYDEAMKEGFEDWELWQRMCKVGAKIITVPLPLFHYRIKKTSMLTESSLKRPRLIEYMVKKNTEMYREYVLEAIMSREKIIFELKEQINALNHTISRRTKPSMLIKLLVHYYYKIITDLFK